MEKITNIQPKPFIYNVLSTAKSTIKEYTHAAKKAAKKLIKANGYSVKLTELQAKPQYNGKGYVIGYFVQSAKVSVFIYPDQITLK